jgi:Tol biopolymer transport system component
VIRQAALDGVFRRARAGSWSCSCAPRLYNEVGPAAGFEGKDEAAFSEVGINLNVLEPGVPMAMYHEEPGQAGFLVLRGQCLLIVEGTNVRCAPATSFTVRRERSTSSSGPARSVLSCSRSAPGKGRRATSPTRRRCATVPASSTTTGKAPSSVSLAALAARLIPAVAVLTFVFSVGAGTGSSAFPGRNGDILFSSLRVANDPYRLYLIRPDGTHERRTKTAPFGAKAAPYANPILSRDGTSAVYLKASRSQRQCLQIYVRRTNSTSLRRLSHGRWCSFHLAWAPDGKRIAFQAATGREFSIWSMSVNGTGLRRLTHGRALDGQPAWSPDGSTIAFVRGYPDAIWLMNADGSNERQLTTPPKEPDSSDVEDTQPDWSPDGKWILFTRAHESYEGPTGHARRRQDIFRVRPDGTGLRQLTRSAGKNVSPAWSPDGKRIVFASSRGRGDYFDIYVMNANGGGQKRLTKGGIEDGSPKWLTRSQTARMERK